MGTVPVIPVPVFLLCVYSSHLPISLLRSLSMIKV